MKGYNMYIRQRLSDLEIWCSRAKSIGPAFESAVQGRGFTSMGSFILGRDGHPLLPDFS